MNWFILLDTYRVIFIAEKKFESSRLVQKERGCDTAHVFYKNHCLVQKIKRKFKTDSLENFIEYRVDYVWDE